MDAVYLEIREIARKIAARYPQPDFYGIHRREISIAEDFFQSDPSIIRLRKEMTEYLDDNAGHGMGHAEKVAIDAGAIVIIESRLAGKGEKQTLRNLLLAQCAGLLHDICRKEKSHAEKGAEAAHEILQTYSMASDEIAWICTAIRNHEAFRRLRHLPCSQARMLSDCLYDADKFRWGPDNFTHTVWDMVAILDPPLTRFMAHYPRGMALLKRIRDTFRSKTGQKFGPQFIDMGIRIGEELHQVIISDFIDTTRSTPIQL